MLAAQKCKNVDINQYRLCVYESEKDFFLSWVNCL